MIQIDCSTCPGLCCTSKTRAVLAPQEVERFKDYATKISTKEGDVYVMNQNEKGQCVFYDPIKNGCTTYETRPFECRMFPYVIYYENEVDFKLDRRFCPNVNQCIITDIAAEKARWNDLKLPLKWIKAYTEIDNL